MPLRVTKKVWVGQRFDEGELLVSQDVQLRLSQQI